MASLEIFIAALLTISKIEAGFQAGILDVHNSGRNKAGLSDLTWDAGLASDSQTWATSLKTDHTCTMTHSPLSSDYGENLWAIGTAAVEAANIGRSASQAWYNEISKYKYPGENVDYDDCIPAADQAGILHFTQIMWHDTAQIGCGWDSCAGSTVVVCRYSPAGNWANEHAFPEANFLQLVNSGESITRCGEEAATESPAGGATESPAGGATESPTGGATESPAGGATESPEGGATENPTNDGTGAEEVAEEEGGAFGTKKLWFENNSTGIGIGSSILAVVVLNLIRSAMDL